MTNREKINYIFNKIQSIDIDYIEDNNYDHYKTIYYSEPNTDSFGDSTHAINLNSDEDFLHLEYEWYARDGGEEEVIEVWNSPNLIKPIFEYLKLRQS